MLRTTVLMDTQAMRITVVKAATFMGCLLERLASAPGFHDGMRSSRCSSRCSSEAIPVVHLLYVLCTWFRDVYSVIRADY